MIDVNSIITINPRKGKFMKNWYRTLTKEQKIFVYLVSMALVLAYLIGLIPLAVLIYLELGERGNAD